MQTVVNSDTFICMCTASLCFSLSLCSSQSELHPRWGLRDTWLRRNRVRRVSQPQLERQQSRVDAERAGEGSGKPVQGHQRAGQRGHAAGNQPRVWLFDVLPPVGREVQVHHCLCQNVHRRWVVLYGKQAENKEQRVLSSKWVLEGVCVCLKGCLMQILPAKARIRELTQWPVNGIRALGLRSGFSTGKHTSILHSFIITDSLLFCHFPVLLL